MFNKILIANRGEIAVRVIRACRDLGIQCVAVYSEADAESLHVRMADESVCVGPQQAASSYLNIPNIIAAAEITGADAIHPGYGFLAENPKFAEICGDCNIKFIGPSPQTIDTAGNKSRARQIVASRGIPIIEGSKLPITDSGTARDLAAKIGYPILLKAVSGGGGKGMRVVQKVEDLDGYLSAARMEAKAAFGDDAVYLEKYIEGPRHIEVQILADSEGNVIHLGERECSVQRRHQKLVEESPSVAVTAQIRKMIGNFACRISKEVEYVNAGTIEFLMDSSGRFYFIEMNTRLQVEHPVTELVTGIDIVKEQIRIAFGHKLELTPKDLKPIGHAIEFRINAEDPDNDFAPTPGLITSIRFPMGPWVRVDSHIEPGSMVQPFYDSMIAKLIVWGRTRPEAIARARRALDDFEVTGIKTTVDFHKRILQEPAFLAGDYDIRLVSRMLN